MVGSASLKPVSHSKLLAIVPVAPPPTEFDTVVPVPSPKPHLPTRPAADVSSPGYKVVKAVFHIRTSSIRPLNEPGRIAPAVFKVEPIQALAVLADCGVAALANVNDSTAASYKKLPGF